ncbi:MAG: hypothetical protein V4694_00650 [Pseudomonadota bacterium]
MYGANRGTPNSANLQNNITTTRSRSNAIDLTHPDVPVAPNNSPNLRDSRSKTRPSKFTSLCAKNIEIPERRD